MWRVALIAAALVLITKSLNCHCLDIRPSKSSGNADCTNAIAFGSWTECEANIEYCWEKIGWMCCRRRLASCPSNCRAECGFSYRWFTKPCSCHGYLHESISANTYELRPGARQSNRESAAEEPMATTTAPVDTTVSYNYANKTHTRLLPDGQCGLRRNEGASFRILGGHAATRGSWKWSVALVNYRDTSQVFCGGTLVAPSWVLTAAHCLHDASGSPRAFRLVIAEHDRTIRERQEIFRTPEATFTPPGYAMFSTTHDVALVKLNAPVNRGPNVEFACLPENDLVLQVTQKCYATGWGKTHIDSDFPTEQREVELPLVGWHECRNYYPQLTRRQLCAGTVNGRQTARDTCIGDSGGGLVCKVLVQHNILSRPSTSTTANTRTDIDNVAINSTNSQRQIDLQIASAAASRPRRRKERSAQVESQGDDQRQAEMRTVTKEHWFLYGVTSFGDGCGTKYGVYQRVSAFVDWMRQVIELE